jgi:uncharacterized membrane protein
MFEIALTPENVIATIANFFELIGALIIFYGSARVAIELVMHGIRKESPNYDTLRLGYTSKIVLALEFFVANDLTKTILNPTFEQAGILALIVGIRVVIGYSLNRELKDLAK